MTTASGLISSLGLERIFDGGRLRYELAQGTVRSLTQERVIYLSTDVLSGVYHALKHEAGPAWTIILKNCGRIWGRRLMASFDNELRASGLPTQSEASVGEFVKFTESYFPLHGWGKLTLDLTHAARKGVVLAELEHSLFVSIIEGETVPVDALISGVLASFFTHVSGRDLDCVELCCAARPGVDRCRFAITSAERLEPLEGRIEQQEGYEKLLASLLF